MNKEYQELIEKCQEQINIYQNKAKKTKSKERQKEYNIIIDWFKREIEQIIQIKIQYQESMIKL